MNSFVKFAAVNTKIRALESRFLNNTDFDNLLRKRSVPEIASYLKRETHYRTILENTNENEIHRYDLEMLIRKDHGMQIEKIYHYLYDGYKRFFKHVFIKREVEELKEILRDILNGRANTLNRGLFPNLCRYSNLSVDALISSRNIDEFIRNLKGTIYYRYLQPLEEGKNEISLFIAEMVLDLAYFDMFYRGLKYIDDKDRRIIDDIHGSYVDLLNIQWIYRGLKYYSLSREILFNYTIPHGKAFSVSDIKDLCYSKDLEELQAKVLNTKYSFLFDNENTKDMFMERRTLRYQYFNVKRLKGRHEMNISEAIAFEILLEYEIRDIVTVIESIRYDMPPDEAKRFLIRKL